MSLPPALLRAANRMDQSSPWLILLDIAIEGEETMRIVNNNEDVSFGGHTYLAFAFTVDLPKENSKGEIPSVQLSVANVTRVLQAYVEQYQGGVGAEVTLRVVNADHLDEDYTELTVTLTVIGAKSTAQWVVFTLGAANPLNRRFPPWQYIAGHCRFRFKSPHCGYAGNATTCSRTLDNCRQLNNSARFGGHPGLDGRGIRLV